MKKRKKRTVPKHAISSGKSAVHQKGVRNKAVPQAVSIGQLNTRNVLSKVNSNTIYDRNNFFLFIQNNKLQTQIQLQTWTDKKT